MPQALSAKKHIKTQRAASNHTTWASEGPLYLVDGGCFSKAKIRTSACKVRLSSLVRGP
jgi:hypothetical protein